jgi:hypothetical protein
MFNLSRSLNYRDDFSKRELSDRSSLDDSAKIRLPRHISSLESYQHHHRANTSRQQNSLTYSGNQNTYSAEATDLAVNILRYQLQDTFVQQKHLENWENSLQHRLQVARAKENHQLVTMLQEELRQLEASK